MSERGEFVQFVGREGANLSALARRYGISRKTGYKWLRRVQAQGPEGLLDRSRRPHRSPTRTPEDVEALVCALRAEHPAWGGRKLHHVLRRERAAGVPAPSTITGILDRNGWLAPERHRQRAWQRFEEAWPNALWQMDFKGHFPTGRGRCHPFTVLDDHSRFNICLTACADERAETVRSELSRAFQRFGLPERMLMDNGAPWGSEAAHPHTKLTAWLIRHGVTVLHGRPYHPQTQGKEERFHRTLALEVLARRASWPSPPPCSRPSTPGALSTTCAGPTRRWTMHHPPRATSRARDRFPRGCRPSSTLRATRCGRSSKRAASPFAAASGWLVGRLSESRWPCGLVETACGRCTIAIRE